MSLLQRIEKEKEKDVIPEEINTSARNKKARLPEKPDTYGPLKKKLMDRLVNEVVTEDIENGTADPELEKKITGLMEKILAEDEIELTRSEKQKLTSEIIDEMIGFGPINCLINDPDISEIMVNGPKQIYVEKNGKLVLSDVTFRDDDHVMRIIDKIVSALGRRIDESSPMVDARLANGSRVNAVIPPLAIDGPSITIRKFSEHPFTIMDLVNFKTLDANMARLLKACVEARLNIIVSGGTGSGKTSTLNVLSSFIPPDERIITVEDAAELQLEQDHVLRLETRPANIEGKGAITIRDLVRNSLRMRPDRIVVGEVRGGEALDMLQAMNTGHDGSLTTGHANTPRDMLARLETMVLMSGMNLPVKAIREQISSAIDLIVQQSRFKDGSRRITHITEVVGMEGDIITLQDIFIFKQHGTDSKGKITGETEYTGVKPKFWDKFEAEGINVSNDILAKKG